MEFFTALANALFWFFLPLAFFLGIIWLRIRVNNKRKRITHINWL